MYSDFFFKFSTIDMYDFYSQENSLLVFSLLELSHPDKGDGNPFQYSSLENSKDRGDWWSQESLGWQRVRHD